MSDRIEDNGNLARMRRFIRINGPYLFVCELGHRAGVTFRRWMLAGKLSCPDITMGPHCHLRGLSCIRIGKNFHAAEGLWLEAIVAHPDQTFSPSIVIGDNVYISRWSHIAATHRVEIGNGVLIGSNVLITDHGHGQYRAGISYIDVPSYLRPLDSDKSVVIGKNVWLGDGSAIMPGVRIGESCVIGTNSVVTQDVPPFTIAAGVPAKPIKTFDFATQEWRRV